jgi:hypothetical protein
MSIIDYRRLARPGASGTWGPFFHLDRRSPPSLAFGGANRTGFLGSEDGRSVSRSGALRFGDVLATRLAAIGDRGARPRFEHDLNPKTQGPSNSREAETSGMRAGWSRAAVGRLEYARRLSELGGGPCPPPT